jgi:hypothetical protein
MAFDIEKVLKEMASAASKVLSKDGAAVGNCVKSAIKDEEDALKAIAEARLAGEITDDDVEEHLDGEKDALKAALLACQVKAKATAQKAINAALEVFNKALKAALKAI